ncbi:MAG: ATP-binding protein, partial [Gemmatimonadota bacterium]|nr:ATP-binding protein [Gemmatimonadota bacterium]
ELVRRLMAFGRNEPGRVRSVDLGELVSGYARTLQRILPDNVRVEVTVGAAVPHVRVDPGAVQQVVLNLATNARDAMPRGGVLRLTVSPEGDPTGSPSGVRLSVADTGTGIEPDVLGHVFEPFFTTKDPERGTGLGLSMVREVVRQMDGSIEAASVLGEGTEFTIHLPAASLAGDPVPDGEKPAGRPAQGGVGTILIVEDDASVRKVIRRALAAAGYEVIVTADGEQALEAFNRHPEAVDLVVSDLIMPNMDGASLHSALQKREGPPVPFLFISGYGDRDPRMEELMARGVPILHKPWSVAALCEAVQDALGVSSDSKEVDSGPFRNP